MIPRPVQILTKHLVRIAIAYIRQSTPDQVLEHTGSTALQRDLPSLFKGWGWPDERIEVMDDLGVSAATPGRRRSFNLLLERMRTGTIGIVAVTDISRLGRNNLEFVQFAMVAAQYDVLLYHSGQIVDFRDPTNEFIGLLLANNAVRENKTRADLSRRARRKKAEDGRAVSSPPVGYVSGPFGAWNKEDDPRVREVTALVFDRFLELGSAGLVAKWMYQHKVALPGRLVSGPRQWTSATKSAILHILRNPAYAGTYVYGKTTVVPMEDEEATDRIRKRPRGEWVWIENHHEPYVDPVRWAEIQKRLDENGTRVRSSRGRGEALVQGRQRCTEHHVKIRTIYPYRGEGAKRTGCYWCCLPNAPEKIKAFGRIPAWIVDRAIESELFRTLSPPTVSDLREVARAELRQHEALARGRQDEERKAQAAVAAAERAYFETAPDALPYARERFAKAIDAAERRLQEIRATHLTVPLHSPGSLADEELEELRQKVADLPSVWRHPNVTPQQRKAVLWMATKEVLVTHRPDRWTLQIEWASGVRGEPIDVYTQRGIRELVGRDHRAGYLPAEIASRLTERDILRPVGPFRGQPYDEDAIRNLIWRHALPRLVPLDAYRYIRDEFARGTTVQALAAALNERGMRHWLGAWTASRVQGVINELRREEIEDVAPLPAAATLVEPILLLHRDGLAPRQIAERLRERGLLTRRRRPPTTLTVRDVLRSLEIRPHSSTLDPKLVALFRESATSRTAQKIAALANELGYRTLRGKPWSTESVCRTLRSLGIPALGARRYD